MKDCKTYRENDRRRGTLYGVSVGPGDPELMTLKAVRIIKESPVIALPNESLKDCVAYQIASQAVPEIAEKEILCLPTVSYTHLDVYKRQAH